MPDLEVRLGTRADVAAAVAVYERSNLARRHGTWPSRSTRIAAVTANLHVADAWFLIGRVDIDAVAMALVRPFRAGGGTGAVLADAVFLDLIYVLPEHWGRGIGGRMLDAVIAEAARRGCHQMYLWTHEHHNERAQRLYLRRSFARTGRTADDASGQPIGEWRRDGDLPE